MIVMTLNEETKNTSSNVKTFCQHLIDSLFTGVIFAIIASLLTTYILETSEKYSTINNQLQNISNIYIGSSRTWADETFGTPEFTATKNEYSLCVYISDYYVLQIIFDEADSTRGYIVTAINEEDKFKIEIKNPIITNKDFKNIILGEFTYYDFPGKPQSTTGYSSNGVGRYAYGEHYYYGSSGGYHDYFIATLDYGVYLNDAEMELHNPDLIVDDEVTNDIISGSLQLTNRKLVRPNSFGVFSIDTETFESMILDYALFDSLQLRFKVHYTD